MLRNVTAAVLTAGLILAGPASASAATWHWNSASAPLSVYSKGASGTLRGQAYGSVTLTGADIGGWWKVSYTGRGYLRDRVPGNNSIYWQNFVQVTDSSDDVPSYISARSDNWNGSSWHLSTKSRALTMSSHGRTADIYRKVCEDVPLHPDPCHGGWKPTPLKF